MEVGRRNPDRQAVVLNERDHPGITGSTAVCHVRRFVGRAAAKNLGAPRRRKSQMQLT